VKIRLAFLDAVWLFAPAPPVLLGEPRLATELLACSIAYHDPQGRWNRDAFKITDVSTRPDGTVGRRTVLRIDNARGRFEIETDVRRASHRPQSDVDYGKWHLYAGKAGYVARPEVSKGHSVPLTQQNLKRRAPQAFIRS
jgi:hypothetical protein